MSAHRVTPLKTLNFWVSRLATYGAQPKLTPLHRRKSPLSPRRVRISSCAWSGSHQNSTLTYSVRRSQNVAVNSASVAEGPGGPSVGCTGQGSKGPSENRMGNRAGQRAQSDREDGTPSSPRGGLRQAPTLQRSFTRPVIRASRSIFI